MAMVAGLSMAGPGALPAYGANQVLVNPAVRLSHPDAKDQDDMCVWIHPTQPELSLVITSDKSAGLVCSYNLQGDLLQSIPVPKPGNIDIRQRVLLADRPQDIVVVNQRADGFKLVTFEIELADRRLRRLDNQDLLTGPNYGGCLYHSADSGKLYFICTSDAGTAEQYELQLNTQGRLTHKKVRAWPIGKCEGAVADDKSAHVYISEETKGVWRFPADPAKPSSETELQGTLVAKVGEHGLKGDVEGLAFVRIGSDPYLIVSDQGLNRYSIYRAQEPFGFVGSFSISGAEQTDGIEVVQANLGPAFPKGLFACHTDRSPRPVLLAEWEKITASFPSLQSHVPAK